MTLRLRAPAWGLVSAVVMALVCVSVAPAAAQPKKSDPPGAEPKLGKGDKGDNDKDPKTGKPKVFDFNALDLAGRMRSPQLLYFLERANEELERASLEKRSFIPHLVRSLEEEAL